MRKIKIFHRRFWITLCIFISILLLYPGWLAYRHLIYHGDVQELTFKSADIKLKAVLVKPSGQGPHPAIILLHGAGKQTADKWYYKYHTNLFVKRGFAVLSFDKRGSGGSEGDLSKATLHDLVNDGVAAVAFLRSQSDINPDKIGLFGVSESGWLTPEIASTDGRVAFIINRASAPISWKETVLFEVRNDAIKSGISEKDTQDIILLLRRIWQFYLDVEADKSVANGPERTSINAEIVEMQKRPGVKDFISIIPEYEAGLYAVRASKYAYDPYPFLTQTNIPMLYIMAGQDVNIPFDESISVLEKLKTELKKDITIKTFPKAGHYLYKWNKLPIDIESFYVSGYSDSIKKWVSSLSLHE